MRRERRLSAGGARALGGPLMRGGGADAGPRALDAHTWSAQAHAIIEPVCEMTQA
jgi:hypothetical protein